MVKFQHALALEDAWLAAHLANLAHLVVPTTGETVGLPVAGLQ